MFRERGAREAAGARPATAADADLLLGGRMLPITLTPPSRGSGFLIPRVPPLNQLLWKRTLAAFRKVLEAEVLVDLQHPLLLMVITCE